MSVTPVLAEAIPAVCLLDDMARILKTSRRTIEKLRRTRTFPIPELPSFDKRPRWSGDVVRQYLATNGQVKLRRVG